MDVSTTKTDNIQITLGFGLDTAKIEKDLQKALDKALPNLQALAKKTGTAISVSLSGALSASGAVDAAAAKQKEQLEKLKQGVEAIDNAVWNTFKTTENMQKAAAAEMLKHRTVADEALKAGAITPDKHAELTGNIDKMQDKKSQQASRDLGSGIRESFANYVDSATNSAENIKAVFANAFTGMENALMAFVATGKLEFQSLMDAITQDLTRMAIRESIGSLFKFVGWGMGELFPTLFSAKGNAFSAGTGLSAYRNTVVTSPTYFAFARGGIPNIGLMGEKAGSPGEAVMPLIRTDSGDLGVRATGAGAVVVEPQVTINIENNASAQVSAQTSRNANGGLDIRVLIDEIDSHLAQKVTNGTSRTGAAMDRTRNLNRASALYA